MTFPAVTAAPAWACRAGEHWFALRGESVLSVVAPQYEVAPATEPRGLVGWYHWSERRRPVFELAWWLGLRSQPWPSAHERAGQRMLLVREGATTLALVVDDVLRWPAEAHRSLAFAPPLRHLCQGVYDGAVAGTLRGTTILAPRFSPRAALRWGEPAAVDRAADHTAWSPSIRPSHPAPAARVVVWQTPAMAQTARWHVSTTRQLAEAATQVAITPLPLLPAPLCGITLWREQLVPVWDDRPAHAHDVDRWLFLQTWNQHTICVAATLRQRILRLPANSTPVHDDEPTCLAAYRCEDEVWLVNDWDKAIERAGRTTPTLSVGY